ncbi:MAG: BTAD domain-containing putative transcriptional regulator [Beijerinckiaceae bacterium]
MRISLFGNFSIRCGDHEVRFESRKAKALIGYLVLSGDLRESRERLVGLLWSETDEQRARASLRQTLFQLREIFAEAGFDGFESDKLSVGFAPGSVEVDVAEAMAMARQGVPHPYLLQEDRAFDAILRDFESVDEAFRVWLLARRQTLQTRIVVDLEDALRRVGDQPASEAIARALYMLDATQEEAARVLIRRRAEAGDIGGALGLYKNLWQLLEDEYDVEPSTETQELIAQIKLAQPLQPPRASAPAALVSVAADAGSPAAMPPLQHRPPPAPKIILTVRGFDAKGTSDKHHYLIEGFRRELIGSLVRFREWAVRDEPLHSAGEPAKDSLPNEYILDASGFESQDGVRLLLMLRDAVSSEYLWSERFQLNITGWFEAQQHIVRRLSTALNVSLSASRLDSLVQAPEGDQTAYDLWLQAQAVLRGFNPQQWSRATDIIKRIIERYPNFAPAYSSLAQWHNIEHIAIPGTFRKFERTEEALDLARSAARIDPIDSRSQLCLAWSHAMASQHELSEVHARLAYELNDNDPWTVVSAATCLAFAGAREDAKAIETQLLSLPVPPSLLHWAYIATNRFLAEDYEGCVAAAANAGDINVTAFGFQAAALYFLGDTRRAREVLDRLFAATQVRWVGKKNANALTMARWLLHLFPIRIEADWERLREGLIGAGAPGIDFHHGEWWGLD